MTFEDKHQPKTVADLIFADQTAKATCQRYATRKPYKHLMLWGPPGTAKTTTAQVIIRERYRAAGYDGDVQEFNGADLTPDDFGMLLNAANMLHVNCGEAVLLINEIDEIKEAHQPKLRSWLDDHKSVTLIATTNEAVGIKGVKQKIMPALQSRFERVELAAPSLTDCLPRAQSIMQREGLSVTQQDLKTLLSTFAGDLRDLMPLLEQAVDEVTQDTVPPAPAKAHLQVVSSDNSK